MTNLTQNTRIIEIKNPASKRSWGCGVTEVLLTGTLDQLADGSNLELLEDGQMFWKGDKVIRSSKDGVNFVDGWDCNIEVYSRYRKGTIKIEVLA